MRRQCTARMSEGVGTEQFQRYHHRQADSSSREESCWCSEACRDGESEQEKYQKERQEDVLQIHYSLSITLGTRGRKRRGHNKQEYTGKTVQQIESMIEREQ